MGGGRTYHVKDGEDEEEVVEDSVHSLPGEGPDGDAVAQEADHAHNEKEHPLDGELEGRHLEEGKGVETTASSRVTRTLVKLLWTRPDTNQFNLQLQVVLEVF